WTSSPSAKLRQAAASGADSTSSRQSAWRRSTGRLCSSASILGADSAGLMPMRSRAIAASSRASVVSVPSAATPGSLGLERRQALARLVRQLGQLHHRRRDLLGGGGVAEGDGLEVADVALDLRDGRLLLVH